MATSNPATAPIEEPGVAAQSSPPRFSSRLAYAQTFAATIAIRCLGMVSGVLAARLLGPTGRGELAVIVSLPMLLVPLGEIELPRSLAYEVSRISEIPRQVISTSFWVSIFLGLIQAILLVVLLPFYLPMDKMYLLSTSRWFLVYLPAAYILATLLGSDQGKGRFGRFSLFLLLPGLLYVTAILASWLSDHVSPKAFAAGILTAAILAAALRTQIDWAAISSTLPDRETAIRLLKRGWNYYLPAVASFALSRADMFILVRLAPTDAIGLYAVGQAIALGQIGAVNPFIQVGFAAVAREEESQNALQALARHFRTAQIVVIAVGVLAIAVAPWLIRFMFGSQFTGAITTAYLLIGSTVVWGIEQVLELGLRAANHPRPGIISNLIGLVTVIAVGIPACLHYGIVGLACATLAAQSINLLVLVAFCVLHLHMPMSFLWAFNRSTLNDIGALLKSIYGRVSAGSNRIA